MKIVIALLHHGRDEDAADGGGVRNSGAGNAREDHGGDDVRQTHAAADVADELIAEDNDLGGDAAGVKAC